MFRVIEINGVASVGGVDWLALTGTARDRIKQRKSHIKLREATHKIDLVDADTSLVGLLSADSSDFTAVTYSAAAWFAKAAGENDYQTVVLVKKIDKDNVWLCAATNGLPAVRGDRIVARAALENAVDDVVGRSDNTQLLIDASESEAKEIAEQLAMFGDWGRVSIEDYIGDTEPQAKVVATGVSGTIKIALLGGVFMAILAVAAFWMYSSNEEERLRLAALAAQTQQIISPDEIFFTQFKKYFAIQPRYSARELLMSMWIEVRGFQLSENGWDFKGFECISAKDMCTVNYTRTPFAKDITFDPQRFIAISKQIDTASALQHIEATPLGLPAPLSAAALLKRYDRDTITVKALPLLRAASDISLKTNFGKESPVTAIAAPGASIQLVEGHWAISGDMAMFEMVKSLPEDFMLDVARIERTEHGVEFRVEGSFWIAVTIGPSSTARSTNP